MSVISFDDLVVHHGHEIQCVLYGNSPEANPQPDDNIALECVECSEILLDFNREADNEALG